MTQIIDCHLHAHWPSRFAYSAPSGSRIRDDQQAQSADALDTALSGNGVHHALLIQPGAYGHDNSAMLEKIAASGGRYKGIAALPVETTSDEIAALQDKGIVGVRLSMIHGNMDLYQSPGMKAFLQRCRERNFFVEVFAPIAEFARLGPLLEESGVRVIVEHFGYAVVDQGLQQPGFKELLQLGRNTDAVIKISNAFRVSAGGPPYADLVPYVNALLEAFGPEHCMWGSDWPFLNTENGPLKKAVAPSVTYRGELDSVSLWISDETTRDQVLFHTPAALFGF